MTILAITAALIGAALGLRFKIFILLPATVISSAVTVGFGIAIGHNLWAIVVDLAATIPALQIGYLMGSALHFMALGARVHNGTARTMKVAQRSAR